MFFDKKFWKSIEFYYPKPSFHPLPITDIAEAMKNLLQERHNHIESCNKVTLCRRKKLRFNFANVKFDVAFFITAERCLFGRNVGNEYRVILIEEPPQELKSS